MFVLLFGLMGVAAVFPVGNHFAGKGEQYDRGAALAEQAFADIKARGMLNPSAWLYSIRVDGSWGAQQTGWHVMRKGATAGSFNIPYNQGSNYGAGHAFVLDPLGVAVADPVGSGGSTKSDWYTFPYGASLERPWPTPATLTGTDPRGLAGTRWPIRRITVPSDNLLQPTMTPAVAEHLCRLRDDLANDTPDDGDKPGSMKWSMQVVDAPDKPDADLTNAALHNDLPLARNFSGSYSWIATIVPQKPPIPIPPTYVDVDWAANSFQPTRPECASTLFDVSVAVFHKRDVEPSATSERMLEAEILGDGEVAIYANASTDVDAAVDGLLTNQWIALVGARPSGQFVLQWYKILHLDDETTDLTVTAGTMPGRMASIQGPDWPEDTRTNLRAIIMPGVISVVTHQMTMESN